MMKLFLVRQVPADWSRAIRTTPALMLGIVMVSVALMADVVKADVLYDTTAMSDNGTYNHAAQNYIGGFAFHGDFWDVQAADDFTVGTATSITSVTGDFLTDPGALPAQGVLVEFFADLGGTPSGIAAASVLSSVYTTGNFDNHIGPFEGLRITVDLSTDNIVLGTGTWWLAITPVDETETGTRYLQTRQIGLLTGHPGHVRDGGAAHGNGYDGGWPSSDWTAFGTFGGSSNNPGDLAMRVEGIPAPGILAIFAMAAIRRTRHRS